MVLALSKLNQQRCRRFKSAYEKQILKNIGEEKDGFKWDTTAITLELYSRKIINKHL